MKPPGVECHFVVAACENMINDKAVVPSDILTASNGKTIEVLNTDAEGRLTLADALVYCDKELDCSSIIELSTLTGACMVALGKSICGVWTDNDDLASELEDVAKKTEEKAWRMPMEKSVSIFIKKTMTDVCERKQSNSDSYFCLSSQYSTMNNSRVRLQISKTLAGDMEEVSRLLCSCKILWTRRSHLPTLILQGQFGMMVPELPLVLVLRWLQNGFVGKAKKKHLNKLLKEIRNATYTTIIFF